MEPLNLSHNFLYSCVYEKQRGHEQFVPEHAFGIILSGESHFSTPEGTEIGKEGMIGLIKRNQLLKTVKIPAGNADFKSINLIFEQEFLNRYAAENDIMPTHYTGASLVELKTTPFLKSFFDSLLPYFDNPQQMTKTMAELKTREALELLLKSDPCCKELLFDFREPHKIDLEAYMNKNYTYNVAMAQFAKLTGRSLATFKRDFQKIFNTSPERWLQQKRLEHAHFLLSKKNQSPGETYLDVGFENFSHFSTAFKKFYGYTPSSLSK